MHTRRITSHCTRKFHSLRSQNSGGWSFTRHDV